MECLPKGDNKVKAVFIIDIDSNKIGNEINYISIGDSVIVLPANARVKPLPDRKEDLHYPCNEYLQAVNEGWNACLDEITGETE